jgi:hypothetical protein
MTLKDRPQDVPELQFLRSMTEKLDRGDPLDEAIFSAAETVLLLTNAAGTPSGPPDLERIELLRQALASARATVVAAGYALTTFADGERMSKAR